jgi:hypothetical protein
VGSDIYLPKTAFASKGLLSEVVTHEIGHVILNNSLLSSIANTYLMEKGDLHLLLMI